MGIGTSLLNFHPIEAITSAATRLRDAAHGKRTPSFSSDGDSGSGGATQHSQKGSKGFRVPSFVLDRMSLSQVRGLPAAMAANSRASILKKRPPEQHALGDYSPQMIALLETDQQKTLIHNAVTSGADSVDLIQSPQFEAIPTYFDKINPDEVNMVGKVPAKATDSKAHYLLACTNLHALPQHIKESFALLDRTVFYKDKDEKGKDRKTKDENDRKMINNKCKESELDVDTFLAQTNRERIIAVAKKAVYDPASAAKPQEGAVSFLKTFFCRQGGPLRNASTAAAGFLGVSSRHHDDGNVYQEQLQTVRPGYLEDEETTAYREAMKGMLYTENIEIYAKTPEPESKPEKHQVCLNALGDLGSGDILKPGGNLKFVGFTHEGVQELDRRLQQLSEKPLTINNPMTEQPKSGSTSGAAATLRYSIGRQKVVTEFNDENGQTLSKEAADRARRDIADMLGQSDDPVAQGSSKPSTVVSGASTPVVKRSATPTSLATDLTDFSGPSRAGTNELPPDSRPLAERAADANSSYNRPPRRSIDRKSVATVNPRIQDTKADVKPTAESLALERRQIEEQQQILTLKARLSELASASSRVKMQLDVNETEQAALRSSRGARLTPRQRELLESVRGKVEDKLQ